MASSAAENQIKLWNVEKSATSGDSIGSLAHSAQLNAVEFLTAQRLAAASADHNVYMWDLGDGQVLQTLTGHSEAVTSLHALGNERLASGSEDLSIKLWSVNDGQCERTFTAAHSASVTALLAIAGGSKLISASRDGSIKVWRTLCDADDDDECSDKPSQTFVGHTDRVTALEAIDDVEMYVASASADSTIKVDKFSHCKRGICLCSFALKRLVIIDNYDLCNRRKR